MDKELSNKHIESLLYQIDHDDTLIGKMEKYSQIYDIISFRMECEIRKQAENNHNKSLDKKRR